MSEVTYCQGCRRAAAVKYCEFKQGIGMLVVRTQRGVKGNMCRDCASKHFWKLTGLTLLTGWWGMISFVMNIVFIVSNISYFIGSRSLPSPGGQAFPIQPQSGSQPMQGRQMMGQVPPAGPAQFPGQTPSQVLPPGQAPQNPLARHRQDIILRLRGGATQAQVVQYISSQNGIPPADVQNYIRALMEGKA